MKLFLDSETGYYHARYKDQEGRNHTISTKVSDKREAEKIVKQSKLRELELTARAGRLTQETISRIISGKKVSVTSCIQQWCDWRASTGVRENSINSSKMMLNAWAAGSKVESIFVSAVTEKHINQFVNNPDKDWSFAYRRMFRDNIAALLAFASVKGWIVGNPGKLVKVRTDTLTHAQKEKRGRKVFTSEEIVSLLMATKPGSFQHTAVVLGRYTGLRLRDIACLEWETLSIPGKIIVHTRKTNKRIELPIVDQPLKDAITALKPVKGNYVFPGERETILSSNRSKLSVYFGRLFRKLKMPDRTFHDMRSTYATDALTRGLPMKHISRNLGHSFQSTTMGYLTDDE